jgi:hypothetical protein
MTSSNTKYLYTATLERDIYIIELNPNMCLDLYALVTWYYSLLAKENYIF